MKRGDLQSNGLPSDEQPGGDSKPRPSRRLPSPNPNAGPELDLDEAAELEIIDATLEGDVEAFSSLFERYRPDLHGFCLRRLDDPSEAEDVVQEIFIRALKNLPNFDRSKRIWPWFATIALRLCTDIHRERSRTHYSGDIGVTLDAGAKRHESVLDSVIASEGHAELMKSLKALPERQRRALELYALEGLSYEDIAAAEGISVGAVKLLLVRARIKMRSERQNGAFGLVAFPFTWLGWKVQRTEERIRPLLGFYGEGLSSICAQAVCLGALVTMVVAASLPGMSFDGNEAVASNEAVLSATQSPLLQTASLPPGLSNNGSSTKAPVEPQQSVADSAGSLADDVINPYQDATPENTTLQSLTPSPNYESDHTILAVGTYKGNRVLLASHDGGASWKPLASRLLFGSALVLPPDYPQDRRIFAFGDLGLQQSDDGGEIFRTVSPLIGWGLAISPSFGREDSRILIGASMVGGARTMFVEYDADTGVTQPGLLSFPTSLETKNYFFVAFSPGYPSDPSVLVTAQQTEGKTILYRCKEVICDEVSFPFNGPLKLRFSPRFNQDGLAYAFADKRFLVSNDGIRTFREVQFPFLDSGRIYDVAVLRNKSTDSAIFVSVYGFSPGIYRSLDAGRSWNMTSIGLPGFEYGAIKLIVTPTGRLLAVGAKYGIACSENGGKSWTPRCPPE